MPLKHPKRVNLIYLDDFIEPWCGLADDDALLREHIGLDLNDADAVRDLVERDLRKGYEAKSPEWREKCALALRYCLSKPGFDFQRLLDGALTAFEPRDARLFYVRIWESLFPGQEYLLRDWKEYLADWNPSERLMEGYQRT